MSEHLWGKRPFLSLLHNSGTPSLPPDTRNSYYISFNIPLKTQNTSFQVSFPLEFSPITRTAYPVLILVFPLLLALSPNDTWCWTQGIRSLLLLLLLSRTSP